MLVAGRLFYQANSFNSRSREGSDSKFFGVVYVHQVSIHAPARGATTQCKYHRQKAKRFQFTLPRGERPLRGVRRACLEVFQFTLPRGERHGF